MVPLPTEPEPDTPIVAKLKTADSAYLALQRACEAEVAEVMRRFAEKQQPLLEERAKLLAGEPDDAQDTGTPAIRGFWLTAAKNHPALSDQLEEWDGPILEYLRDVTKALRDPRDQHKGFKLDFHFAENPYFENTILSKEYISEEHSPYTGSLDVSEIRATSIQWKAGQDVTVAAVKKKTKGGGSKKKAKETFQPRASFFRSFFRTLKEGMKLPKDIDVAEMQQDSDDEEGADEIVDMLMSQDHDLGCALRDSLIPYAVRWYTGEAAPEDFDDDDDEEEEEEEEDDEDEEDEEDEEEASSNPKNKSGSKSGGGKKGGPQAPPASSKRGADEKEECKQQ